MKKNIFLFCIALSICNFIAINSIDSDSKFLSSEAPNFVKKLYYEGIKTPEMMFRKAIEGKNIESIDYLLPIINFKEEKIENGKQSLLSYAIEKNAPINIIEKIIEQGANVNRKEDSLTKEKAMTPLHIACLQIDQNRSPKIIELLIKHGANPNAQTQIAGNTPLIMLLKGNYHTNEETIFAVVKSLINKKADPNIKDSRKNTALDYANKRKFLTISEYLNPITL